MATSRSVIYSILVAVSGLLGACTGVNPYFDATKPHHTASGFRNNHAGRLDRPLADILQWQWDAWRAGLPKAPLHPTAVVPADLRRIQAYARAADAPQITWIGHATMLVQAGGLSVLTDPIFSERASPVPFAGPKRAQPPGVALADLPPIDAVLISHNHYDHLDEKSVRALASQPGGGPLFLVPLGLKPWFADLGISRVVELDWWQTHTVKGVEFQLTPVQHWSARGIADRMHSLWGGWAVFAPDLHWYFSGDTGYSPDFADTRQRLAPRNPGGFDLALIPVGAYEPRWFMREQHVDPTEAVRIHKDIGARRSVGIHWGTFNLTDESLDQPPIDLALARKAAGVADADFSVMAIGETRAIAPRQPVPAPTR